ncbi:TetR-like C-terminal domain-containing protein [Macrococcus capreoli]|uniref:TetR/AcrR family transcriptional regulator n=1 Tax=Macrococcus capreoli TaxID=2982690 RepID=UPI0021D5B212|nr:TetR-like C-terminal domain-containing protein [Macrococcus sp. TMW 2.2395]MCU7558233.1 TetR family transcriptional regulator C-terminal domain-containing protein [Macrococcus sp. TMW 2.2395]
MKQDRRVSKSQKVIKEAFIALLDKQSFESITVQGISDLADVNRSTFYAHYLDKFDLLDKLEDEYIDKIRNEIEDVDRSNAYTVYDVMKSLINHIDEDMTFYKMMFMLDKDSGIERKLYLLLNEHLNKFMKRKETIGGIPFDYFMSYITGAGIALIKYWILDTNKISSEDLIEHFYKIVTQGPAQIIAEEIE